MRFPNELCSDHGQAINNYEEGWEGTLTGMPREAIDAWREHFKPLGFQVGAKVVDYPGGMLGDIGLILSWYPSDKA